MNTRDKKKTKQYELSREAYEKLSAEYKELTTVKRKDIIRQMKKAPRGYIDRDEAEARMVLLDNRVAELKEVLDNAQVRDGAAQTYDAVKMGAHVVISTEGDTEEYQIVSPPESNAAEGKISNESPLGAALMGKKVGDCVSIRTHMEEINYCIKNIY